MIEIQKRYIELKEMARPSLVAESKLVLGSDLCTSAYANWSLIEQILEAEYGTSHI